MQRTPIKILETPINIQENLLNTQTTIKHIKQNKKLDTFNKQGAKKGKNNTPDNVAKKQEERKRNMLHMMTEVSFESTNAKKSTM